MKGTQETAVNSDTLWNAGNLLAIVQQVIHCNLLLIDHIHSLLQKIVSYMSSTNQNKLNSIAAKYIIQKWLFLQITLLVYICVYVYMYVCIYACICVFVDVLIYIDKYRYILMEQWWLLVQVKTVLKCHTPGFKCFCFQKKTLRNIKTLNRLSLT